MRIAWMGLHRGEEPPLVARRGSGTVFFTGCPLHCAYCQNCQISRRGRFEEAVTVSAATFARLMVDLQAMGAANINMVTGTHFITSIVEAMVLARESGLTVPMVWNSSGFETPRAMELIDPFVDLYLVDVKTLDAAVAATFCGTKRYVEHIGPLMDWMFARRRRTRLDDDGVLHGILIRHLVFPGELSATKEFLMWFAAKAKRHAWLSLMVQFVPPEGNDALPAITEGEYDELMQLLETVGIEHGFVQELADNIPWIPDFTRDNPFPATFADPLQSFLTMRRFNR